MRVFLTIPFFRILIPFVIGVLIALNYILPNIPLGCLLIVIFLIVLIFLFLPITILYKRVLLILMDLFLFLFGVFLVAETDTGRSDLFYGKKISLEQEVNYIALIDELPLEKEKSIKLSLTVLELKVGDWYEKTSGKVIAYFRKSKSSNKLKAGDVLLIQSRFQKVPSPKNPFEFDYNNYLARRQIYHTVFVDSTAFCVLPNTDCLNKLWKLGLSAKSYILKQLKNSSLSPNSYAVCSALLTGYDDEIDKSVMEAFSHSGTLHVLSVSGLHTGLIYIVLGFFFDLFDKRKKRKLLKFCFITSVLWVFALVTGFSAPVLRSVIMFNLLGLGKIYFRHDSRNQMNILLVSAFGLLVYNPFFICDVGFQLSYFALAGLIFFQPKIAALWRPTYPPLNMIWQSVSASIAATLSTLPLTLFYFKQFPIWFFVCNLIVVPATFVILLIAVLVVLKVNLAGVIINYLMLGLVAFIDLFNVDGYGYVDMIHFTGTDAVVLSVLIVSSSLLFQHRRFQLALLSLIVLLFWQILSIYTAFQSKNRSLFTCYAVRDENIISLKSRTNVFLNKKVKQAFNFHVKPHLISFCNPAIQEANFNYIEFHNDKILILEKPNCWPNMDLKEVSVLILCSNFVVPTQRLPEFKKLKVIVNASSNNKQTNKKNEELCRKFGLNFYDTRVNGAYLLGLN